MARTAADIMNPAARTVHDGVVVPDAVKIMWEEGINELPVMDEKQRVIVELNLLDIIAAYLQEREGLMQRCRKSFETRAGRAD